MNDNMKDYYENLAFWARSYKVFDYVSVLSDKRFQTWSGAGSDVHHHYGDGGLLKHTYEVWEYAREIAAIHSDSINNLDSINLKELFISAVWHDYGKIWDYQKVDGVWSKHDNHARRIHHISRSAIEFQKHVDCLDAIGRIQSDINIDNITHNILSHHGQREWGSPVAPATKEAWILHLADNISARLDDCEKHDRIRGK